MDSFGNCVKSARRGVYLANGGYNVLVLCANGKHLEVVFDEAERMLDASSLRVEQVNRTERKIYCERGGTFFFRVADLDPERLKGYEWPHIIALCAIGNKTEDVLHSLNRTSNPNITPVFQHASL